MAELAYTYTYPNYANALYEALRAVPFYATMERNVASDRDAREAMLRYLDYSIVEANRFGFIDEPKSHRCGVSVWSTPLTAADARAKSQQKLTFIAAYLGPGCRQTYADIVEFMSSRSETVVGKEDWYLSILGVLPSHQGKGLGAKILQRGLDRADASGIATWLETFTPRNMRFYERLGYEAVASFDEPTTNAEYWVMTRDAN